MRYLMILFLAWLPSLVQAVQFDEHVRCLPLGKTVGVLEDPGGRLSIDEVTSPRLAERFQPLDKGALSAGFTRSAFWMRVELTFLPSRPVDRHFLLELAYPPMDHVDLYLPDAEGAPRLAWRTGDMLPFSSRQIRQHGYLFSVEPPAGQAYTLYLRVASHGLIQAPLNLWSTQAYIEAQPGRLYLLGAIYGVLIGLLAYNLFVFITGRDPVYLWYVLHLACFALFQLSLNGVGIEFLWPDSPWWANVCTPFFISGAILFAAQFSRRFLDTRQFAPWADRTLVVFSGVAVLAMGWSVLGSDAIALRLSMALAAAFGPLAVAIGVLALKRKQRLARYFIAAWVAFGTGTVIKAMTVMALLPTDFLALYASHIGVMVEVALLSLALGDRVNWLREQQAMGLTAATEDLARANRLLAVSNRLKDQFLSSLTHELRTPMNGVVGSLELMQGESDQAREFYRQIAMRSAQDMMNMVDGILMLTELQAGHLQVQERSFSLYALLEELRVEHAPRAEAKGLGFESTRTSGVPDRVRGDPAKLRKCLDCLLDNAVKFTPRGGVSLTVTACESQSPGGESEAMLLCFEVSDTGIGFDRLADEEVYQSFFQMDGSITRQYGGLGIGLAICRQLIVLLGGRLHHRSVPDEGSRFFLELPLQRAV